MRLRVGLASARARRWGRGRASGGCLRVGNGGRLTYVEIGLRLQISHKTVGRIARSHGYDASKRIRLKAQKRKALRAKQRAKAAFEKARAEAERKRRLDERDPLRRIPAVPAWAAKAGLTQDYRDFARQFDEDHAARECRKLTAQRRQQEALDARLGRAA